TFFAEATRPESQIDVDHSVHSPKTITVALNLTNDRKNLLDLAVRFFVTTDAREDDPMDVAPPRCFGLLRGLGRAD
ncbi:MAG: hypothetical protein KC486_26820, partial [Myxococcales bacterium]|nr:hypothetical protein [Myxococcales bacterium]